MTEPQKDTQRAIAAAKLIIDGRDPNADHGAILVTLEGMVSLILLAVTDNDANKAAFMFNEGLVPGVEAQQAYKDGYRRGYFDCREDMKKATREKL